MKALLPFVIAFAVPPFWSYIMNFSKTEVWGFEHAIRGMRQPLQSHSKSDSEWMHIDSCLVRKGEEPKDTTIHFYKIGKNDLELAQKLIKAGSEHRKFLRQIFVATDITAPLYWWKEADQYKVGTTTNSTSTMHKLASTPITMECFEMDDFEDFTFTIQEDEYVAEFYNSSKGWECEIRMLEILRQKYNETKEKKYWKALIRKLPESWLQTRTVTMNYENLLNMYHQRCIKPHKLTEWSVKFKEWVESLPYAKELIIGDEDD